MRDIRHRLSDSGYFVTFVVVLLAYAVAIWGYLVDRANGNTTLYSAGDLALGIVLGIIYMAMALPGPPGFRRTFGRSTIPIYFTILTALVVAIFFLLATANGIWLVAMPLVALAATEIRSLWRWLVYLSVLGAFFWSIFLKTGNLENSIVATLTLAPAVIFVIFFVRLTQSAEAAQAKAERLAAELEDANNRLAAYAVQAEELATTQERNRLAREIHDNLGHYLTVVNVQIKAAQAVMDKEPAKARAALAKAALLTQEGLVAVRQSVSSLRDSPLGSRSLTEAIGVLVAETQASGIVTELRVAGTHRALDPRAELTLYRTAQEGLTNVRRHARASRADLTLHYQDSGQVSLLVRDNGPGLAAGELRHGFGLLGLQERARQLGGNLEIETAPGQGFCLAITVPDAPPDPATPPELIGVAGVESA